MAHTVLVADGERRSLEAVTRCLRREGFEVETATDGGGALDRARHLRPALVVLDLLLPGTDGWEVCRRLRQQSDVPIIMLNAYRSEADAVAGLELGADDYLTRPFDERELVARVKAVLRRARAVAPVPLPQQLGDVWLDPEHREICVRGRSVTLRAKELSLLMVLAQNLGRALPRQALLTRAWGYSYLGDSRTVDVHIGWLRGKLAGSSVVIHTVRGVGYRLTVADAAPRVPLQPGA